MQSFEVERILKRRVVKRGCDAATEYLIRWKSYRPEHDVYTNVKAIDKSKEVIQECEAERRNAMAL